MYSIVLINQGGGYMDRQIIRDNVLTRREAEKFLNLSSSALQYHLREGNIKPFKTHGEGRGAVQLFLKDDLIKYQKMKSEEVK